MTWALRPININRGSDAKPEDGIAYTHFVSEQAMPLFRVRAEMSCTCVPPQLGPGYRYFLVFQDKDISMTGAYPMSEFLKILAEL